MAPSSKNPSHGQKVDLGRRAPETHEGVGDVEPGSLAAESAAFQSSNEVSEGFSSTTNQTSSSTYRSMGTQSSSATSSSARTAGRSSGAQNLESQTPSDMSGQQQEGRRRLPGHNAPHGRNLHEDNDLSGENASFTQYGTEADPAYLAERKFEAMDSMPAGSTGGAGREKHIDDKNIYDALGSENNA
ncbi:hypothetical protein KJ359_007283 [Pestalotiopsis sp. 9143b]|nr:hypothetical protein KJ359_007283 [Pestalotiopsis sp. 9143b]